MTPAEVTFRILTSSVSLVSTVAYLRKRDRQQQAKRAVEDRLRTAIKGAK